LGVVEPPDGLGTTAGLPVILSTINFVPAPIAAPVSAFTTLLVVEFVFVFGGVTVGLTVDVGGVVLVGVVTGLVVTVGFAGVVGLGVDVAGFVAVTGFVVTAGFVVLDVNVVFGTNEVFGAVVAGLPAAGVVPVVRVGRLPVTVEVIGAELPPEFVKALEPPKPPDEVRLDD